MLNNYKPNTEANSVFQTTKEAAELNVTLESLFEEYNKIMSISDWSENKGIPFNKRISVKFHNDDMALYKRNIKSSDSDENSTRNPLSLFKDISEMSLDIADYLAEENDCLIQLLYMDTNVAYYSIYKYNYSCKSIFIGTLQHIFILDEPGIIKVIVDYTSVNACYPRLNIEKNIVIPEISTRYLEIIKKYL